MTWLEVFTFVSFVLCICVIAYRLEKLETQVESLVNLMKVRTNMLYEKINRIEKEIKAQKEED